MIVPGGANDEYKGGPGRPGIGFWYFLTGAS